MLQQTDRQGDEAHALQALTRRLVTDYAGCCDADQIKAVVDAEQRRFVEASVRVYVPLLIERFAREALDRRTRRS